MFHSFSVFRFSFFHISVFGVFHSLYSFQLQFSRWVFMRLALFVVIFFVSIIEFEWFVIAFGIVGTSILFGAIYGCSCQFTNKSSKMICIDIPCLFLQCRFRSIPFLVSICLVYSIESIFAEAASRYEICSNLCVFCFFTQSVNRYQTCS